MKKKIFTILSCLFLLCLTTLNYRSCLAEEALEVNENVKIFLDDLESSVNGMDTYRFTVVSENWKDKKHSKKTLRFHFKKPNLMRTDVIEGRKKGSTVLLNKKGKIRGKNSWGFKTTLKPTDKRLENIRGYSFMNSSLLDKTSRLKSHILERGCNATVTEKEYMGKLAYHLHIDHDDLDDAVTDEDVWFDKKTLKILKNLKYECSKKVTDTTWLDLEINIPLDDNLFHQ